MINVIILKSPNKNSIDNCLILERPCYEWVKKAAEGFPCKIVKTITQKSLINALKQYKTKDCKVLVLFSDTPLITKETINTVLDYFILKKCTFIALIRGYILHSSAISKYMAAPTQVFSDFKQEFMRVQNENDLKLASQILQERIFMNHVSNRVEINKTLTTISLSVVIGQKTKISAQNYLSGLSTIGKSCTLYSANVIINSKIGNNCVLMGVKLMNCTVKSGTILMGDYVLFGAKVPRDLQILP